MFITYKIACYTYIQKLNYFFPEISASSVLVVASWRVIYVCDDRDRQKERERDGKEIPLDLILHARKYNIYYILLYVG